MSLVSKIESDLIGSTYTTEELSYLLAGRTNPEAVRARSILGLEEFHEGDDRLLPAVQSLASRRLATADGEDIVLSPQAKVLGYIVGNSTDWTRIVVKADDRVEALIVAVAPEANGTLVLRTTALRNYETVATKPGVHPSQITGMLVTGIAINSQELNLGVHRDKAEAYGKLVVQRHQGSAEWTITARAGIEGFDDLAEGESLVTDESGYLRTLEALIA